MSFIVVGPNSLLLPSRWDRVGETIMYNLQVIKSHSHNAEQEWKWFLESLAGRGEGQMAMLMVIVRSNAALKMGTLGETMRVQRPTSSVISHRSDSLDSNEITFKDRNPPNPHNPHNRQSKHSSA